MKPSNSNSGREIPNLPKGNRNEGLFKYGCSLRACGADDFEIRQALEEANQAACQEPLPTPELNAIIKSVLKYPKGARKKGSSKVLPLANEKKSKPAPRVKNWAEIATKAAEGADPKPFARKRGVRQDSLRDLGFGYFDPSEGLDHYSWPEKDGLGKVIGIGLRGRLDDRKSCLPGSRRGLIYSNDCLEIPGNTVFIFQGFTDVAAGLTMGVPCLGQPMDGYGAELLADLFRTFPGDKRICVGIENDENPESATKKALKTAQHLSQKLSRPILTARIPDKVKDVNDWLIQQRADLRDIENLEDLGELFISKMLATAVEIIPPARIIPLGSPASKSKPAGDLDLNVPIEPRSALLKFVKDFQPIPIPHVSGKGKGCLTVHEFRCPGSDVKIHGPLYCDRWSCSICQKRNAAKWCQHFDKKIAELRAAYIWEGDATKWPALRKALRRAAGEFGKMRLDDGHLVVVASVCVAGFQQVAIQEASAIIEDVVYNLSGRRPISCSNGWKLEKKRKGRLRLRRVRRVGTNSRGKHLVILRSFGINPIEWKKPPSSFDWIVSFLIPKEWAGDEIRNLYAHLIAGEVLAEKPSTGTG